MSTLRNALPLTVRPNIGGQTFTVELNRDRMERLAAGLGFFRPEFLASLERAEREIAAGKTRRLRSLRDLRSS